MAVTLTKGVRQVLKARVSPLQRPAVPEDFEALSMALGGASLSGVGRLMVGPSLRSRITAARDALFSALAAIRAAGVIPESFRDAHNDFVYRQQREWPIQDSTATVKQGERFQAMAVPLREDLSNAAVNKAMDYIEGELLRDIDDSKVRESLEHIKDRGNRLLAGMIYLALSRKIAGGDAKAIREAMDMISLGVPRAPLIAQQFNAIRNGEAKPAARHLSFDDLAKRAEETERQYLKLPPASDAIEASESIYAPEEADEDVDIAGESAVDFEVPEMESQD